MIIIIPNTILPNLSDASRFQAIIDGASISLPHGTLTECYDELGSRYQLPVYCLSSPTNLVRENSGGDEDDDEGDANGDGDKSQEDCGLELPLKLRLSTGQEVKVYNWNLDFIFSYCSFFVSVYLMKCVLST